MSKLLNAGQSPFGFHRLHSFMQCPTKYFHSYVSDEPRPKTTSPSLIVGSLVHTALAHRYSMIKADQNGEEFKLLNPVEAILEQAKTEGGEWLNWIDKSIAAYNHYINSESTREFEDGMTVLAVETVFSMSIETHTLTFRADLLIEKDGLVYFVDHKTCAFLKSTSTDGYQASGQFLSYITYGRKAFSNFGGMLLNYIAHGGQRSQKLDTKIVKVVESEDHLLNFTRSVYFYFEIIKKLEGMGIEAYPRVQSEFTCTHKYGKCNYYDRCFGNTTQNIEDGESNND